MDNDDTRDANCDTEGMIMIVTVITTTTAARHPPPRHRLPIIHPPSFLPHPPILLPHQLLCV